MYPFRKKRIYLNQLFTPNFSQLADLEIAYLQGTSAYIQGHFSHNGLVNPLNVKLKF